MPSFDVQITGGAQGAWVDVLDPSRLNPNPAHPHTRRLVAVVPQPSTLVVRAVVGGVLAPLDANPVMAGRLFTAVMARWSGDFPPVVTQTAGKSSEITITLHYSNRGHQQLLVTLSDDGGRIGVPFDGYWAL